MFNIGKKIQRKKRKLFSFLLIKINKIFPSLYTLLKIEIEKKNYRKILNKKIIKPIHVKNLEKINSYEFKITSQNGEDGIIEHIFSKIEHNKRFFEVGCDYRECNSINLLKNKWSGHLIDANQDQCEKMCKFLKYSLMDKNIKVINKFVEPKNLNSIVSKLDIDFFSLDIDGNDYWVMKSLNLDKIKVICCEYNPFFGKTNAIAIPYDEKFEYKYDNYFGASLMAYTNLLKDRGFDLIAVDSSGTNAFFVNKKYSDAFEILSPELSYKASTHYNEKDFLNIQSKVMLRKLIYL